MSDIKLISPMLDNFNVGEPISDQSGVRCYPAMKENEDDRYIVKVVSIPASQTKLDALLLAGAYPNAEAANNYFKELADGVISELNVLGQLSEQEGFMPISQWQVVPMENGETGYDVYMLTSYKRTLKRQFYKEPLTHLNAVNLGLDMCAALAVCRRAGYLFVDLKPSNIFVTSERKYKISDLGFIKLDSLMYASLPAQYRSAYTAPEVADAFSALSSTMDIYALGLVLYQTYNNGALPFSGERAPAEVFPAPDYADYEMSEIILKACDPDPAKRWQDPIEMGQAIISYMQRNGANDTPIVPPAPVLITEPIITDIPEIDDDTAELSDGNTAVDEHNSAILDEYDSAPDADNNETVVETDENELVDEDPVENEADSLSSEIKFLLKDDEEELESLGIKEDSYNDISNEVTEILEQADELAAHDVPDMEEVIEEIQETEPQPESASEEAENSVEQTADEENHATEEISANTDEQTDAGEAEANADASQSENTVIFNAAESVQEQTEQSGAEAEAVDGDENCDSSEKPKRRGLKILITLLVLLALAAGAYCAYKFYYIKNIQSLSVDGSYDTLTVSVVSDADPALLTVYCIGNGNRTPADLVNGKAYFSNLAPDQTYTISVEISGFHGLKGKTSTTYFSPKQVALEGLTVKVGETDGSAKISFTTKQPFEGQWNVEYVAEGEDKQNVTSDNQDITINNLTIGKTYDITITPVDDQRWITNNTCTFTAQPLILAEAVTVADYTDGNLNLVWQSPAGTSVTTWTVHCYNDTDYNKTLTVSDCKVSFDGLNPLKSYTVEIYADQQSQGQTVHIDDTTLPIENFTAKIIENNFIELSWTCSKPTPEEGWIIKYTLDGVESENTFKTTENTLVFKEVIPGTNYVFSIDAGNGAPVIVTDVEITANDAQDYSSTYDEYTVTKEDMTLRMCTPPDSETWSYKSLYNADYTNKLEVGEKAGIVARVNKMYSTLNETEIFALYIIRDQEGNIVLYNSQELIWKDMWNNFRAALTIPETPAAPGNYTVEVYLNGGFLGSLEFEIVE